MRNLKLHLAWASVTLLLGYGSWVMASRTIPGRSPSTELTRSACALSDKLLREEPSSDGPVAGYQRRIQKLQKEAARLKAVLSQEEKGDSVSAPSVFEREIIGMLTASAGEKLQLDPGQTEQVNQRFQELNRAAGKALASSAVLNESESDPDQNLFVYDIPALPDRGEALLQSLKEQMAKDLGVAASSRVHKSFIDSEPARELYGGYGRYDLKITVQHSRIPGETKFGLTGYDPVNGSRRLVSGSQTESDFRKNFGDIPIPSAE